MESLSKQELISTITKQADQIKRYEGRLRDVVQAYKGLSREKDALKEGLDALKKKLPEYVEVSEDDRGVDSVNTVLKSLQVLTEEKARMEEAFQGDKLLTKQKYETKIEHMKQEAKAMAHQHAAEAKKLKAKIAYEIQERERERAEHATMIKELQLMYAKERKNKENADDKSSSDAQTSQAELEKQVRDLSGSLDAARRRLQRAEARAVETPALLVRMRNKLALLEQSHAVAIREEQIKVIRAEESAHKMCARQEERVALLEDKIAELSVTVGTYDARRRQDQQLIRQLKTDLNAQLMNGVNTAEKDLDAIDFQQKSETDNEKLADSEYLQTLIDKIHILKKELIAENEKLGNPIDITTVFKVEGYENMHLNCKEEYENLKMEFEEYKKQKAIDNRDETEIEIGSEIKEDVVELNSKIAVLKGSVEHYKLVCEAALQEKNEIKTLYEELRKTEQEVKCELLTRVAHLENQLTTQRSRYAALLTETDSYLRRERKTSVEEKQYKEVFTDATAPPHMLHYAHELARKDLDISQLRREKHVLEGQFRDYQREAMIEKEQFKYIETALKTEIDRLQRAQSREGANLEYLKNVMVSYLASTDAEGRTHMLKAIAAILKFSTPEWNALTKSL